MVKPSSSRWMRWSYLALVPVLAAFMFACNPSKKNKTPEPESLEQETPAAAPAGYSVTVTDEPSAASLQDAVPFAEIQVKPTFNGGDANEFSKWVNERLKYPEQAKADKAQGRVVLQFTVGADGVVRDVKVLKGVREDLDAEALRVISASPQWGPGMQDGKAVPVTYVFPVVYQLK